MLMAKKKLTRFPYQGQSTDEFRNCSLFNGAFSSLTLNFHSSNHLFRLPSFFLRCAIPKNIVFWGFMIEARSIKKSKIFLTRNKLLRPV